MSEQVNDAPAATIDRHLFLREWVKDLRSGEFKQCRGMLHNYGTHCCLGVARLTLKRLGDTPDYRCYPGEDFISASDRLTLTSGVTATPMACNDDLKMSFAEIADAVERTWPEAFVEAPAQGGPS